MYRSPSNCLLRMKLETCRRTTTWHQGRLNSLQQWTRWLLGSSTITRRTSQLAPNGQSIRASSRSNRRKNMDSTNRSMRTRIEVETRLASQMLATREQTKWWDDRRVKMSLLALLQLLQVRDPSLTSSSWQRPKQIRTLSRVMPTQSHHTASANCNTKKNCLEAEAFQPNRHKFRAANQTFSVEYAKSLSKPWCEQRRCKRYWIRITGLWIICEERKTFLFNLPDE